MPLSGVHPSSGGHAAGGWPLLLEMRSSLRGLCAITSHRWNPHPDVIGVVTIEGSLLLPTGLPVVRGFPVHGIGQNLSCHLDILWCLCILKLGGDNLCFVKTMSKRRKVQEGPPWPALTYQPGSLTSLGLAFQTQLGAPRQALPSSSSLGL